MSEENFFYIDPDEELEPDPSCFDDMEAEHCHYGGWGSPAVGTEYCEFQCPLSESCNAHFDALPNCKAPHEPVCPWFDQGKCQHGGFWTRIKCRFGYIPQWETQEEGDEA